MYDKCETYGSDIWLLPFFASLTKLLVIGWIIIINLFLSVVLCSTQIHYGSKYEQYVTIIMKIPHREILRAN